MSDEILSVYVQPPNKPKQRRFVGSASTDGAAVALALEPVESVVLSVEKSLIDRKLCWLVILA